MATHGDTSAMVNGDVEQSTTIRPAPAPDESSSRQSPIPSDKPAAAAATAARSSPRTITSRQPPDRLHSSSSLAAAAAPLKRKGVLAKRKIAMFTRPPPKPIELLSTRPKPKVLLKETKFIPLPMQIPTTTITAQSGSKRTSSDSSVVKKRQRLGTIKSNRSDKAVPRRSDRPRSPARSSKPLFSKKMTPVKKVEAGRKTVATTITHPDFSIEEVDFPLAWAFAYIVEACREKRVKNLADLLTRLCRKRYFHHEKVEMLEGVLANPTWKKRRVIGTGYIVPRRNEQQRQDDYSDNGEDTLYSVRLVDSGSDRVVEKTGRDLRHLFVVERRRVNQFLRHFFFLDESGESIIRRKPLYQEKFKMPGNISWNWLYDGVEPCFDEISKARKVVGAPGDDASGTFETAPDELVDAQRPIAGYDEEETDVEVASSPSPEPPLVLTPIALDEASRFQLAPVADHSIWQFVSLYQFLYSHRDVTGIADLFPRGFFPRHLYRVLTTTDERDPMFIGVFHSMLRCISRIAFTEKLLNPVSLEQVRSVIRPLFGPVHLLSVVRAINAVEDSCGPVRQPRNLRDFLLKMSCTNDKHLSTLFGVYLALVYRDPIDPESAALFSDDYFSDPLVGRVVHKLVYQESTLVHLKCDERLALLDLLLREIVGTGTFGLLVERQRTKVPVIASKLADFERSLNMLDRFRMAYTSTAMGGGTSSRDTLMSSLHLAATMHNLEESAAHLAATSRATDDGLFGMVAASSDSPNNPGTATNSTCSTTTEQQQRSGAAVVRRSGMSTRVRWLYERHNRSRLNLRSTTRRRRCDSDMMEYGDAKLATQRSQSNAFDALDDSSAAADDADLSTVEAQCKDVDLLWDDLLHSTLSEHERRALREILIEKIALLEPSLREQVARLRERLKYARGAVGLEQLAIDHEQNHYYALELPSDKEESNEDERSTRCLCVVHEPDGASGGGSGAQPSPTSAHVFFPRRRDELDAILVCLRANMRRGLADDDAAVSSPDLLDSETPLQMRDRLSYDRLRRCADLFAFDASCEHFWSAAAAPIGDDELHACGRCVTTIDDVEEAIAAAAAEEETPAAAVVESTADPDWIPSSSRSSSAQGRSRSRMAAAAAAAEKRTVAVEQANDCADVVDVVLPLIPPPPPPPPKSPAVADATLTQSIASDAIATDTTEEEKGILSEQVEDVAAPTTNAVEDDDVGTSRQPLIGNAADAAPAAPPAPSPQENVVAANQIVFSGACLTSLAPCDSPLALFSEICASRPTLPVGNECSGDFQRQSSIDLADALLPERATSALSFPPE